jgi:hypothetical protein
MIFNHATNLYQLEDKQETLPYGDADYLVEQAGVTQEAYLSSLVGKVDQIGNPAADETWENFPHLRIIDAKIDAGYVFVDVVEQADCNGHCDGCNQSCPAFE